MAFPEDPCDQCPRVASGLPMPCKAMTSGHARYCELAAQGRRDYVAFLCRGGEPEGGRPRPPASHAEVLARRAGKLRLPLGVKTPPGRR